MKYDKNRVFLIMKEEYEIMKITNILYNILSFFKKPQTITPKKPLVIDNQKVNWDIVEELIEINYLKPI